ncbi:MAG TPA: 30S ribosome-binding factor RbfA [Candidatus Tidjanibacter faecipullorum]|uniref:Ribosome-binding factor A n=1 Tax=Candidatus Tidjanibacter faecipullorum TaxID=2838766 RepID=A0A9D2DEQ9_9BACT|nr:30S ribosome-binding factor RbfA [Candidatus Tidjanibacter faecipullorum]
MESTRQSKVAKQIQKDISDIFSKEGADLVKGAMVTVTAVRMSPDLGYAKIYLSIFPFEKSKAIMDAVTQQEWRIRKALGSRIRNQLRIVPELTFFLDDSLEYIENIDNLLR